MDWGGHWVVVTGYDTRGTETVWDNAILFADSVDCHDDRVDGFTYFNYGEFDAPLLPKEHESQAMGGGSAGQRHPAGLRKRIHFSLSEGTRLVQEKYQ
jgi:hypothetical protein